MSRLPQRRDQRIRLRSLLVRGMRLGASAAGAAALTAGMFASSSGAQSYEASLPSAQLKSQSTVHWKPCGAPFECARVKVPLDYDRPQGRQITLAVLRLPASNPAARIGSLIVNPGGPGISGVDFVRSAATVLYPPEVRARFDIVGLDPRGVGASTPIRCFSTGEKSAQFWKDFPVVPSTRAEVRRAKVLGRSLAQHCEARQGWLLPHLSTADVARDVNTLRAAVGDRRLTFIGYSYGSYLGATYANLFPNRVRALALDALVDAPAYTTGPRVSTNFVRQNSHLGSAETLDQFFRLCVRAGSRCDFGTPGNPARKFATLAERLKAHPVRTPDGVFGYAELLQATVNGLFAPMDWDVLASGLQSLYATTRTTAHTGAAAELAALGAAPAIATDAYDNGNEAAYANMCSETREPRRLATYQHVAAAATRQASYVGDYWAFASLPCARWPAMAQDRYTGPWATSTSTPPLLLTSRFDPAAPYRNAVTMNRLLRGSRLVTVNGWGHGAMYTFSPCADGRIEQYLTKQILPRSGATCRTGVTPFAVAPPDARQDARHDLLQDF